MARFLPILSSRMVAAKYDRESQRLVVQFNMNTWYEYDNVPSDEVVDFMFADSIGAAFSSGVEKKGYPYRRISRDQALS